MTLDRTHSPDGSESSLKETWRAVLAAIDDRILRACLPTDIHAVALDDERMSISVDSEFKKEYCVRKIEKIEAAVAEVVGARRVTIGEPPLIEKAREETTHRGAPARILVMGIGDGGVNAVGRMREERLQGVRLVAVDTDRQVLDAAAVPEDAADRAGHHQQSRNRREGGNWRARGGGVALGDRESGPRDGSRLHHLGLGGRNR